VVFVPDFAPDTRARFSGAACGWLMARRPRPCELMVSLMFLKPAVVATMVVDVVEVVDVLVDVDVTVASSVIVVTS
jgi:hypothetical protein